MIDPAPSFLAPTILSGMNSPAGRAELVEWRWPPMIDFTRRENEFMVEMSLPPTSADASACFPEIDPDKRCMMGTLFVRWPGTLIAGRGEAGHIRVVRCVLAPETAARILDACPAPDLGFLQAMLAMQSEPLRTVMRLMKRELETPQACSARAVAALIDLVVVELERCIVAEKQARSSGRLAPWQFRRIRDRLDRSGPNPTVPELAALCGISVRHLHRQFHALTGKTVADYIETTRMEQAKVMLERFDRPIKSIAEACGFAHPGSFARAFRRTTGFTPLTFRQSAAGVGASRHTPRHTH